MIKKINMIVTILIIISLFIIFLLLKSIFYRPNNPNILITPNEQVLLKIITPNMNIIAKDEETIVKLSLSKECDYQEGKIVVSGSGLLKNITGSGTEYFATIVGLDDGNIILNIKENAFCDNEAIIDNTLVVDSLKKLKTTITEFFKEDIQKIGLYYYDINTKKSFGINEQVDYFPASVSKLMTVLTLYDLAFKEEIDLEDTMYYEETDFEADSGVIQKMDLTQAFKLRDLAKYAIVYSDNIAFHMLNRYITSRKITNNYETIIGHPVKRSDNGTPFWSAKDAYLVLQTIYENKNDNPYYEELINYMKNTTATNTKIVKYLPCPVARKGGNYQNYHHDVAIIYDEQPYILTFFSYELENANELTSQVAKLIHEFRR